jgi:hypothetical protein
MSGQMKYDRPKTKVRWSELYLNKSLRARPQSMVRILQPDGTWKEMSAVKYKQSNIKK